ncbi:MAG: hypothetical protein ACLR8H_13925 [Clostridium sp.]
MNVKLNTVLYKANLDSLDKIFNRFNKEITIVLNTLSKNFNENIKKNSLYLNDLV